MKQKNGISNACAPPSSPERPWFAHLLRERSVQITWIAWLVANVLILVIAHGVLPFNRPVLAGQSFAEQVVSANLGLLEVFLLMGIVQVLTRKRKISDLATRAPERTTALRETLLLVAYGIIAQLGGFILGRMLGWHPISFHLVGTLYGTFERIEPVQVFVWASYNFVLYAIVPFLYFRKRYSAEELSLTSNNRLNDLLVIVVVLLIESLVELFGLSSALLFLSPKQLVLGVPLTFVLYFFGTVLPTRIFVYCILIPRYLKLTGSMATTVILGGVTYAGLHFFDGWMVYRTPGDIALSMIFLLLLYVGPGMFKTFLTLRTGNAWVHVWAYHALAPHVVEDTPLILKIFHIFR